MTDVLGWELQRACAQLQQEGFTVCCVCVMSRKGMKGNEARIVRQRRKGETEVELAYSVFKTDVNYTE